MNPNLNVICDEYLPVTTCPPLPAGDDDAQLSADDRKKRPRTAFTAAQIKALESEFEKNKYLSVSKRMQLSKQLRLTETQVSSRFQHRSKARSSSVLN